MFYLVESALCSHLLLHLADTDHVGLELFVAQLVNLYVASDPNCYPISLLQRAHPRLVHIAKLRMQ